MKRMAGKLIGILLISLMLVGCGKSEAVKNAEEAIAAIGEITIESGEAIKNAEKFYNILTDSEKSEVENRMALVEAQEAFETMKSELVYENAKEAYEYLNDVALICENGMDDIYGAWYFGIYEADDCSYSNFFNELSKYTPNITSYDIEVVANANNVTVTSMRNWNTCVNVVQYAIDSRGDFNSIEKKMKGAEDVLQELTNEYDDYTYYPKLKEYYAAVSSYADFYTNPSGSFKQLADTINDYENTIRTYKSDVGFLFTK